jgi:hypothetical protein
VGAVNLGPGRRIVLQDSPRGVSRLGSQAGTQAPDPTPVSTQNRGSQAGSTIHNLPAEYAAGVFAFPGLWLHPDFRFCALGAFVMVRVDRLALNGLDEAQPGRRHRGLRYWGRLTAVRVYSPVSGGSIIAA